MTAIQQLRTRERFVEKTARERVARVLDAGTGRELLDAFARLRSPWLGLQDIVAAADDGVVIARGAIDGVDVVCAAIEPAFQGGSIGEVGGAKIAGALELALADAQRGAPVVPVLLLETGGVRLQEANCGLAAIAEIHAGIVALRARVPVIGVIAGPVGCFGGLSIAAGLCSHLIVTREARLGLNGAQVIEQEAGIDELDARDRPMVWALTGGAQRVANGFADTLCADDLAAIRGAISQAVRAKPAPLSRVQPTDAHFAQLTRIAEQARADHATSAGSDTSETAPVRGARWLAALADGVPLALGYPDSLWVVDAALDGRPVRYVAVVPDPDNPFARARGGEVGLLEGWALARALSDAREADENADRKRAIVAVVDVPSQAYGRLEEAHGIHQALAAAVDAYAQARMAGHAVVALIVGKAMSGAFLAHGYQADRLIALDDDGVQVHAMGKAAAARITQRSVEGVEALAQTITPMAYDIASFAQLGLLFQRLTVDDADTPSTDDIAAARQALAAAIADIGDGHDLSFRLDAAGRSATVEVRQRLRAQWYSDRARL